MRYGVCLAVTPGFEVTLHQGCVDAITLNIHDEVVFYGASNGGIRIPLEGQIDVADVHHQRAVHRPFAGETQAQPTRPVSDGPGSCGVTPARSSGCGLNIDCEVRAGSAGDTHFFGTPQHLGADLDLGLKRCIGNQSLKNVGMFVQHHEGSSPTTE